MSILKKLGLNIEYGAIYTIVSEFGAGKTTTLTNIASECIKEGKGVIYFTEEPTMVILNKIVSNFENGMILLRVKKMVDVKTITELMSENKRKYDIVIIDKHLFLEDIDTVKKLAIDNDCCVMLSSQTNRGLKNNMIADLTPIRKAHVSDCIISLTKTPVFTNWENIKYFFCFWLKKPNRNLRIIKNRYGRNTNHNFHFNFKNNKIS